MVCVLIDENKNFINLSTFLLIADTAEAICEGVVHELSDISSNKTWQFEFKI